MFTIYDDKEILFVVRTVMNELIRTRKASTQTEAWNMEKRALKECLVRLPLEREKKTVQLILEGIGNV